MDTQNVISDEELKDILDKDILELMGANNMPQEKKDALYQKMAQTVQDRVILRIDALLDDQGKQEWKQIGDSGDQAKMEEFLKAKKIDVAKLIVEEAAIYKMEVVALLKNTKEQNG